MRELTTEEKARRYDDAVKVADKYKDTHIMFPQIKDEMFPELAESESEKIRKSMISYFKFQMEANRDGGQEVVCAYNKWISWLEELGVQESYGKTEPKFKVGDWVVNKNGTVHQILSYKNGIYKHTNGYSSKMFEDEWRMWDIAKDAKDGDVLVASDGSIFLFKGTIDCACKHYVALTTDGAVKFNEGIEHYWETSTAVHPATKEQRDLLFAKMKEAGYEWDDVHKQLKKNEQKPDVMAEEWIPQVGDTIRKKGTTKPLYVLCKKEGCEFSFVEERECGIAGGHLSVYALKDYELVERHKTIEEVVDELLKPLMETSNKHNPAEWSEEDYNRIETIACHLDNTDEEGMAEVLRNIRDKYYHITTKNTWKPSEEQMKALYKLLNCSTSGWDFNSLESLYEQLKKIREE